MSSEPCSSLPLLGHLVLHGFDRLLQHGFFECFLYFPLGFNLIHVDFCAGHVAHPPHSLLLCLQFLYGLLKRIRQHLLLLDLPLLFPPVLFCLLQLLVQGHLVVNDTLMKRLIAHHFPRLRQHFLVDGLGKCLLDCVVIIHCCLVHIIPRHPAHLYLFLLCHQLLFDALMALGDLRRYLMACLALDLPGHLQEDGHLQGVLDILLGLDL